MDIFKNFINKINITIRMQDSLYLFEKHPGKIPVSITKKDGDVLNDLEKNNLLIPNDMPFWMFLCILRKRLMLPAHKALFVLSSNGRLLSNTSSFNELYESEKSTDGILRLVYASENAFG